MIGKTATAKSDKRCYGSIGAALTRVICIKSKKIWENREMKLEIDRSGNTAYLGHVADLQQNHLYKLMRTQSETNIPVAPNIQFNLVKNTYRTLPPLLLPSFLLPNLCLSLSITPSSFSFIFS